MIIWITGLPGSGKTTLASAVAKRLAARRKSTLSIDGDAFRNLLDEPRHYSPEERKHLAMTYLAIAKLASNQGHIAIVSSVSAVESIEEKIREHGKLNRIVRLNPAYELLKLARPELYIDSQTPVDPRFFPQFPDLLLTASSERERAGWLQVVGDKLDEWLSNTLHSEC